MTSSVAAVLEGICDVLTVSCFLLSVPRARAWWEATWSEVACSASRWNSASLCPFHAAPSARLRGEENAAAALGALSSLCPGSGKFPL